MQNYSLSTKGRPASAYQQTGVYSHTTKTNSNSTNKKYVNTVVYKSSSCCFMLCNKKYQ